MKINNLTKEEVFRNLVTSENGLSEEEAKKRLSEFGPNEIKEAKKTSLSIRFFRQFTHFLAVLLWIGAGLAILSEYLHPGEGMLTLGLAIIGVIFINAVFTFIQEYRAEKSIEKLRLLLPFHVKAIREGKEKEIPAREVVPGDLIILSEGDKIPADSRLIRVTYLMVNNAPLTGESEPVPLQHEPCPGELIESKNIAFAGTTVVSGSGKAVVFAAGMRTEFGRIAHLTSAVETGLSPLQKEIVKATRIIAFLAAIMGVVFFFIGQIIGRSFWENFIFAVGIIVANVPEGLLPTVTLSLAMGSQRMAKKKALIKTLTSVETLGSVTVICTDKTGTLTQNKMEVKDIWTPDNKQSTVGILMKNAYLCNNAKFIEGQYKGDPTETALLKYARGNIGDVRAGRISEIPFDSERKRMTTVNMVDDKKFAFTKGALESVLPLCKYVLINDGKMPVDEELKGKIINAYHSLMDKGLRVLSFACSELQTPNSKLEEDMVFLGLIGLEDPPRPEVPEAIKKCHEAGIRIIMITGDGSRTAVAIAREIGLVKGNSTVIEGHDFIKMSDMELRKELAGKEIIFARMTPKHKMRVVSILKEEGERVAVTGDGVNDAPALKMADIGIAMGIAGTDVAKEAADMLLLDDNFATIVNAIEEGRAVYENIRKFISYIFSSNIPEIVPYLAYVLLKIPLPLTIMQILAVDLGTDMIPALALGAEKPTAGLMQQPPRDPKERLLNFKLLSRAYLFLGPIEAAAGLFGFFYVLNSGDWKWGEMLPTNNILYMQATTACLTAIIITQIGNVFACRSFRESVFSIGFFSNKLIFAGIAFEIALQLFIVYHPWGNEIFATSPIAAQIWLVLIPFALVLFAAEEARKLIVRGKK
ncbi:MAG TPA: ATPase [Nitrospiraceae bacterium]|nr:MAG: ATPase [Nitrospirae bacterium GWA2_46_11]OGW25869.1 MAG: ATPase [Nitrospirae bacterium GWB2_47_37]HAK89232.1 ATPase [Nitrospiraceae bacterium]HCZ11923.1 ATPase [Nitrospiraceae bacterium]